MDFLEGTHLNLAISERASDHRLHCAVAFWGKGSEKILGSEGKKDRKIICNLKMGGTNPYVIKKMPRDSIKQFNTLHAKVYIGDDYAVVTSANASANGLGLEGAEQSGWIEAGVKVKDLEPICAWFDDLWEKSEPITDDDIEDALVAWGKRQQRKPGGKKATTVPFASFDTRGRDLPLIAWLGNADWDANKSELKKALGTFNKTIERRLDEGIEIEDRADRRVLTPGRWVLQWSRTSTGLPRKGAKFWWVKLGPIVEKAFKYKGESGWRPAVLAAEEKPQAPFDIDEKQFRQSFREVLKIKNMSRCAAIVTPVRGLPLSEED